MKQEMTSIIKKDLRRMVSTRRMLFTLLIVPFVLTVFVPSAFLLVQHFVPQEQEEFQKLLELLPAAEQGSSQQEGLTGLLINYLLPLFFLIIPIMASTIMSASSFVGEKEKQTLETLLYCPLSLTEIFQAKVAASFLLSMAVSGISFCIMLIVLEAEIFLTGGNFLLPGPQWLVVMLLLSPSFSLIAITLIVRVSAKAQSAEDAQQGAAFLLLPVLLLLVNQIGGFLLISTWVLLGLGIVCGFAAVVMLKRAAASFHYEMLNTFL
ncbi:MAG: ABC transporter permease subunit [Eubacterium sp.]|jgi:ABC-type Na+ efflux pump permease subunit|nr:ABC transporter permease subunit [Eubacterium sp.]